MPTERYVGSITGVLSFFERIVNGGTLPGIPHPQALAREMKRLQIFDLRYCQKLWIGMIRQRLPQASLRALDRPSPLALRP